MEVKEKVQAERLNRGARVNRKVKAIRAISL